MNKPPFLPGVAEAYVRERLARAGGNELNSGKFASLESSAALAANAFGWFVERPALLPLFPKVNVQWPAEKVELEYCARFPWPGGRHPWLDAAVSTRDALIGVESKRFEPFRDAKTASFSTAYDRPVWGEQMKRHHAVRQALVSGELRYYHLDAAQLVKHAYGLVTQAPRLGRAPVLFYLFAEPATRGGATISTDAWRAHRTEIADFSKRIEGDAVKFAACSYRDWLESWRDEATDHAAALIERYAP